MCGWRGGASCRDRKNGIENVAAVAFRCEGPPSLWASGARLTLRWHWQVILQASSSDGWW